MNRILVIRGGAIGDFILTLPALKALRDAYPHAQIEILGYKHIAALAENRFLRASGAVDRIRAGLELLRQEFGIASGVGKLFRELRLDHQLSV